VEIFRGFEDLVQSSYETTESRERGEFRIKDTVRHRERGVNASVRDKKAAGRSEKVGSEQRGPLSAPISLS